MAGDAGARSNAAILPVRWTASSVASASAARRRHGVANIHGCVAKWRWPRKLHQHANRLLALLVGHLLRRIRYARRVCELDVSGRNGRQRDGSVLIMAVATLHAAKLSDNEIARLLFAQGWRGDDLETAIRIVLGESGGNPRAVNVNANKTVDRGLWQFNDRAFPALSTADAYNPEKATAFAWSVYQKQRGFRPHRSAWWGRTKFHSLNPNGSPARDLVNRAKAARAFAEGGAVKSAESPPLLAGGGWVWLLLIASLAYAMRARKGS